MGDSKFTITVNGSEDLVRQIVAALASAGIGVEIWRAANGSYMLEFWGDAVRAEEAFKIARRFDPTADLYPGLSADHGALSSEI